VTDSTFLNARGAPDSVKTYFPVLNRTYVVRYYYNNNGALDSTKASSPGVTFLTRKYTYNAARGTLDGITLSAEATTMTQAADLALSSITFPGNRIVNVNRTSSNAVSATDATASYATTTDRQAGYDKNNRVKTQLQLDASTGHRYGYDRLGRLVADSTVTVTGAQCPPLPDDGYICSSWTYQGHLTYTYDAASNRTDAGASYLAGSNHIRNFAGCSYSTDNDGNVTSETCPTLSKTFAWDARNRLTQAVVGTTTYDVRYDAEGRVARLDVNGTATKYFLWDGDDLLAELNSSGAIVLEYSYFPGMDNLHAVKKGSSSTIYYAHRDLQGNVITLTDGSTVSRTYAYSAWGADIGGTDGAGFNGTDRARWKGALLFGEFGLYHMRARWYHPVQGRFFSEDPIGLAGGINPYLFGADDPINGIDPSGLRLMYVPFVDAYMDCHEFGTRFYCYPLELGAVSVSGRWLSGSRHSAWGLQRGGWAGAIYHVYANAGGLRTFGGSGDYRSDLATSRELPQCTGEPGSTFFAGISVDAVAYVGFSFAFGFFMNGHGIGFYDRFGLHAGLDLSGGVEFGYSGGFAGVAGDVQVGGAPVSGGASFGNPGLSGGSMTVGIGLPFALRAGLSGTDTVYLLESCR
jgi:RHS repeat-associated protein